MGTAFLRLVSCGGAAQQRRGWREGRRRDGVGSGFLGLGRGLGRSLVTGFLGIGRSELLNFRLCFLLGLNSLGLALVIPFF
jgi:hypothetical protein